VKRQSGRSSARTPHPETIDPTDTGSVEHRISEPRRATTVAERNLRTASRAPPTAAERQPDKCPRRALRKRTTSGCPFQAPGRLRASPRTARHVDPSGDRTSSRLWSGRSARATDEGAEKVVTGAIISAYLTHAHLPTICCASLSPWSGAAGRFAAYRRYSFPQMLPDARLYDRSSFREAAMGLFYGPRTPMLLQHPNANRGLCSTFFDRTHSGG
jgi:hypothetical protein